MAAEQVSHLTPAERGHRALREGGYASGGHVDVEQDKRMITSALRQHENAEHGGRHENLRLNKGGMVKGGKANHHPGRQHRAAGGSVNNDPQIDTDARRLPGDGNPSGRARGGKAGGKGGIGKVNIVIAHPPGAGAAAPGMMPPRPPMAGPPPVAPPPPRPMMPPPGAGPGGPPMAPGGMGPGGPPPMMPPGGGMPMARPQGIKRGGPVRDVIGRFAGGGV